jgi:hypothetical protein
MSATQVSVWTTSLGGIIKRDAIAAPMSFQGSRQRTRRVLWDDKPFIYKILVGWWLVLLVEVFWGFAIAGWYVVFGIFVVPYRIMRRGSRKRKADQKREQKRHEETLNAIRESKSEDS